MNYKELAVNKPEDFIIRALWWLLSAVNSCHTNPNEANSIKQKCSKDTCETGREVFPYIPARKTERLFLCCNQKGDLIKCFAESPSAEISPSAPETMNKEKQGKPQTNKQPLAHQDVWVSEEFRLATFKLITRAVSHIYMYIFYVCLHIIIFRWSVQIRHWTQTDFPAVPRCCI